MSSKSAASKKRARNSKGSAAPTAAGAGAAADEPTTLQAEPTAAAADGVALDANNIAAGAEGDDAASAALRSSKARKLHVGDAASSDEAAAAAATAPNGIAADEHAATAAANDVSMSNAHAASAPVTPAAAVDGGAAAAADTSVDSSVAGSPAAVATPASSATPSRSPTPAQSSPTSAVTTGGVPKSPSRPTPSPTAGLTSGGAIVVSPLPPLPAGMNRGYCAQFYWSHYPPAAAGSATAASIPAALLPQFTDVVASIPAIFQQIISVLQTLEQTVHNRDILVELDRKIIKPLTPKEAESVPVLDRKLVLKSAAPGGSQEYLIHACRRENVKLVFASPEEGGLIGKLGLCPMLIDLFMVQAGGKKQLQAGVGGLRYGHAALAAAAAAAAAGGKRGSSGGASVSVPEKGADYKCTCGAAHNGDGSSDAAAASLAQPIKIEKSPSPRPPTDRTPAASPARKSRAAAAAQAVEAEPASMDEAAGRDAEMHDDPPQLTAHTAVPAAAASSAAPSTARRVPGSGSDGRGTSGGAFRSPPASGSAHNASASAFAAAADGHALGPATANCSNCSANNKKVAKHVKQLEKMKEELKAVHEERSLWEQKFNDEKDHNIRLFEKILLVQQQLRNMSRPLGVSLTHAMNHIATPSMQAHVMQQQQQQQQHLSLQQQQHNAMAAQAQAQAQAAAHQAQLVAAQHAGQPMYALTHDGLPVAHGLAHPQHVLHPHLMAVDPYHAHSTAVLPLSSAQLAEHLHSSEMSANYPVNVQQQLAEQRSRQQMDSRQEAEIRQQQQQQQQQHMQQQVRA